LNDRKQWVRQQTHPGKLTENVDQAISRDLLAHGMMLAHRRYQLDIRLHVHDQIVALTDEEKADRDLALLIECMEEKPRWAHDLPLGSAGFTTKVFKKD
jgi:DNA polymerase